jgi:hypothetical protein
LKVEGKQREKEMERSSPSSLLRIAVAATAAISATLAVVGWRRTRLRASRISGLTKIDLLPNERSFVICSSPATSTITYFRTASKASAVQHFADRVVAIVAANPWLASILEVDPESGLLQAYFPSNERGKKMFAVRDDIKLSRDMPYHALTTALDPVLCKTSDDSVGTGAPLWACTLVPDAQDPERRFALIVSANHSLLDGHGFYKIYSMLSGATEVCVRHV